MHLFIENSLLKLHNSEEQCLLLLQLWFTLQFCLFQKLISTSEASSFGFLLYLRRLLCPPTFLKRETCPATSQKYNHLPVLQASTRAAAAGCILSQGIREKKVRVRKRGCKWCRHVNIEVFCFFFFSFRKQIIQTVPAHLLPYLLS